MSAEAWKHVTPLAAVALALAGLGAQPALADEAEWATVERGEFRVPLELEGVVESERTWPVRLELEQWSPSGGVKVLEGIEQGARVEEGETLLRFDPEALERRIESSARDLAVSDATIERTAKDLYLSEEAYELELTSARRSLERAQSDLERWEEIERDLDERSAEMSLASAEQQLAGAREELTQLRRMYRDEDLTEESEEIVLRRQEHAVRVAEFNVERQRHIYERSMKVTIPRRDEDRRQGLERARQSLARAEDLKPLELRQNREQLEQRLHQRGRSQQDLELLREDLPRLTVQAPAAGVVYYGGVERGQWSNTSSVARTVRDGGAFQPNAVLMTVLDPEALRVRASIPEQLYYRVEEGQQGFVTLSAFGGRTVRAELAEVRHLGGTQFDAIVNIDRDAMPQRLRPGMKAHVNLTAYEADDALTVPVEAVRRAGDGSAYVEVRGEEDQSERRDVTLGWLGDGRVEVLDGLREGEQVQLP